MLKRRHGVVRSLRSTWAAGCGCVVVAALMVVVGPSPASYAAGYLCPVQGSHCYLIGNWDAQGGLQGIYANVESDCLFDSHYLTDGTYDNQGNLVPPAASNEIWLITNANYTTWVEAGFGYGGTVNQDFLFWAESFPVTGGTQYLEHDASNIAHAGKTYYVQIWKDTSTGALWSAEISGDSQFWNGTSVHPNNTSGISAQAGAEYSGANTDNFHTYSRSMQLGFYDGARNAHSGWANSRGALTAVALPAGYTSIAVAGAHDAATATHSSC